MNWHYAEQHGFLLAEADSRFDHGLMRVARVAQTQNYCTAIVQASNEAHGD